MMNKENEFSEYKLRNTFATESYLKIPDGDYFNFLQSLPLNPQIKKKPVKPEKNGEFKEERFLRLFDYNGITYEIYQMTGHAEVGDDMTLKVIPFPSPIDDLIKNIVLKIIVDRNPIMATESFMLHEGEDLKFIQTIRSNLLFSGFGLDEVTIREALLKIGRCRTFIRRQGKNSFYPLPWVVKHLHGPYPEESYERLGATAHLSI